MEKKPGDLEKETGKRRAEQETEKKNQIGEKGEREKPGHEEPTKLEGSMEQKIKTLQTEFDELTEKGMRHSSKKEQSQQKEAKTIKTTVLSRGFEEFEG